MTLATIVNRRDFIGGSDARVIMGKDEKALLRLWREKRARRSRSTCRGS
jgi:predicted phage-related endonuclease